MSVATFAKKSERSTPSAKSGLRIGPPDDAFEREADRVANEVMSGGIVQRSLSSKGSGTAMRRRCACAGLGQCEECKKENTIQRKALCGATVEYTPPIVNEVLQSPGQPLNRATRNFFEPRFGHDFSNVRVHVDNAAARSVRSQAFTVGDHVVFAAGRYSPDTLDGRKLMAHELTHVVQRGAAGGWSKRVLARQTAPDNATEGAALEHAGEIATGIQTDEEFRQLRCVIEDACPQAVSGGVPDEETDKVPINEKCKARTGYTGPAVWPTQDQCAEMKPGTLEVVTPSRLKQLNSLLKEYAALVVANALRKDEEFGVDAAIGEAEEKLGSLGGQASSPDKAPPVVVGKKGQTVPTPLQLALGLGVAATIQSSPGAFSAGARLLPRLPPQAIPFVVGLLVMGYITNDFLVRKEASDALEKLIGRLVRLFRGKVSPEGEITQQEKPDQKPEQKPGKTGPTIDPLPPEDERERRCRTLAPDATPIRWPAPLWHFAPGIGDPGSQRQEFDIPEQQILLKQGSTLFDPNRNEIRRYRRIITGPPFNLTVPDGWPIHHKWPLYLGGPGDKEKAEGDYDAEGGVLTAPNLVVMSPDTHEAWHKFLIQQPDGPSPGMGPSESTPNGKRFCIIGQEK